MPRDLLERAEQEAVLHVALAGARDARGGIVVVTGEAGIGKTSLVRSFLDHAAGRPRVLFGACDPLAVPRPLGPLIDAASAFDSELAHRLASGVPRAEAFAAALDMLLPAGEVSASILVIEDLHWADEATLDLLTFLGRRLSDRTALMVVTFRNDEVDARHPLRVCLGEVHSGVRARIDLSPLSQDAVAELAQGRGIDATELFRVTAGNPFHVTEVLETGEGRLPTSVRDAVLARVSRLPVSTRAVIDAAAIIPGRVERWLLDAIAADPGVDVAAGLDDCIERGLLKIGDGGIAFRHELARLAIDDALEPSRRRRLNERALASLRQPPVGTAEVSRLAHHAERADAGVAVLEFAPVAAHRAVSIGSNREAATHLEATLRYQHLLEPHRQGELLYQLGIVCSDLSRWHDALAAFDAAADRFAALGDTERQAQALVACERPMWGLGRQPEALAYLHRAEHLIGNDPAPSEAAAAVALSRSKLHMLARQLEAAEVAGQAAMSIAAQIGADALLAEACIISGISVCMSGDGTGLGRIRRGAALAERLGDDRLVSIAHLQVGSGFGELRQYAIAMPELRNGIEFASERELVSAQLYERAWLARCELEVGNWDAAARLADGLVRNPRCVGNTRLVVMVTLGWLRGRRGDPVGTVLDEALDLGRASQHVQRLWPAAACRAEVAWLEGRLQDEIPVLDEAIALATEVDYRPAMEELRHWLSIADGQPRGDAETAQTPFGASAAGRHDLAAAWWARLGCPYEEAMAWFALGDVERLRRAYDRFVELGAEVMRERTGAALRAIGARVPRGVIGSTQKNPFGLTNRELDVLALLPRGFTNAQIAVDLNISPKTVGHHVSKVLAKLDVTNRAQAAVVAERLDRLHRRPREA